MAGYLEIFNYPAIFIARLVTLMVALSIHEFAHAFSAYQLGDSTAERAGRLTLNPLAHLDPIGSLLMIFAGFGWAKPVPVNPYNLRGNKLRGMAVTAAAGPLSNILQAFVFALPIRFGLVEFDWNAFGFGDQQSFWPSAGLLLSMLVWTNLLLAVFNMIPLGPLDGFKVLMGVLPSEWVARLEPFAPYSNILLILLMFGAGGLLGSLLFTPSISMLDLLIGGVW